jgi:hypothetical protein
MSVDKTGPRPKRLARMYPINNAITINGLARAANDQGGSNLGLFGSFNKSK